MESTLTEAIDAVTNLEEQRVHLEGQWKSFESHSPGKEQMKLNFSENMLKMNHMSLARKATHFDARVR